MGALSNDIFVNENENENKTIIIDFSAGEKKEEVTPLHSIVT